MTIKSPQMVRVYEIEKRLKLIHNSLGQEGLDKKIKSDLLVELQFYYIEKSDLIESVESQEATNAYSMEFMQVGSNQKKIEDVKFTFGDKSFFILEEFNEFTKNDKEIDVFIQEEHPPNYINKKQLSQDVMPEALELFGIASAKELADDIIIMPRNITFQPFFIFALAHELGHVFLQEGSENNVTHERDGHAFVLKFVRFLEKKYEVNTGALDEKYSRLGLISKEIKRLLNNYDYWFLMKNDPYYRSYEKLYDQLGDNDTFI